MIFPELITHNGTTSIFCTATYLILAGNHWSSTGCPVDLRGWTSTGYVSWTVQYPPDNPVKFWLIQDIDWMTTGQFEQIWQRKASECPVDVQNVHWMSTGFPQAKWGSVKYSE